MSSLHTYTDIDECEMGNGGCEELCVNVLGTYHCLCPRGFILQDDNHSCEGNLGHRRVNFLRNLTLSLISP